MSQVHQEPGAAAGHMPAEMQRCIEACSNCHESCAATVQECLAIGGRHAEQRHIRLLLDCAQICAASADFMIRQSPLHVQTCRVCAHVCEECVKNCDAVGMRECAEMCRTCAESCNKMAAH